MGRILTEALLDGKAISPSSMVITNRTISKAIAIQENYPSIQIAQEISEVGKKADLIFICVKPHDVHDVAVTLKPFLTKEKCVVSITSPINVEQLEICYPMLSCKSYSKYHKSSTLRNLPYLLLVNIVMKNGKLP